LINNTQLLVVDNNLLVDNDDCWQQTDMTERRRGRLFAKE
jgi:hypothetical protein